MPDAGTRAAVFLDRDGTIIVDRGYLGDPQQVTLIPRAASALERLRTMGLLLVVITNQSGIARGYYTRADYDRVEAELDRQLAQLGVRLDATYHCPDLPGSDQRTTCRKPAPRLYRTAAATLKIDLGRSFYVGDKCSDVRAAEQFGRTGILVRTGQGLDQEKKLPSAHDAVDDLWTATGLIERQWGASRREMRR